MELDCRELQKLKELVPYETLAPTPDEIIKEIERLNNIINELEKYIRQELSQSCGERELRDLIDGYNLLDKLKELKEGKE